MSKLAEIIAKRKAAAEALEKQTSGTSPAAEAKAPILDLPDQAEEPKAEAKEASAAPLSFAERMALKKAEAATEKTEAPKSEAPKPLPSSASTVAKAIVRDAIAPLSTDSSEKDTADEQRYADIHARIEQLADMSEQDTRSAMSDLKKALQENPSAAMLMEDEDVGKMVIALRRITHVTIAEAKAPKDKKPKAAAKIALSPEAIAAAFDEL